jgi:hypothetical protein
MTTDIPDNVPIDGGGIGKLARHGRVDYCMANGEQPEWLNAAGELVRRVSCDASMQVGAAVESVEDVSRLLELAYSSVRGWHPGGRVLLWDDAFGVVVGAWSAAVVTG